MKHNTHIYLAKKSIEFLYDACENLYSVDGKPIRGSVKTKIRSEAKTLQRLLKYHEDDVLEASWAPDDILCDKAVFHTFKLFTSADFSDAAEYALETHTLDGKEYYRTKKGGGLPFKIDHLAKIISDMIKLRQYNDAYSMKGIMYLMIMITHYIVDAHVPMHCDLRDDSPKDYTPKNGVYYNDKYHGELEKEWDVVTTEYAVGTGCLEAERAADYATVKGRDSLKPAVQFDLKKAEDIHSVKVYNIPNNELMTFIINVCIRSKERNNLLFAPGQTTPDMDQFEKLTRPVYADTIGHIISIWLYIWNN